MTMKQLLAALLLAVAVAFAVSTTASAAHMKTPRHFESARLSIASIPPAHAAFGCFVATKAAEM